jgi:hypothetical protein
MDSAPSRSPAALVRLLIRLVVWRGRLLAAFATGTAAKIGVCARLLPSNAATLV